VVQLLVEQVEAVMGEFLQERPYYLPAVDLLLQLENVESLILVVEAVEVLLQADLTVEVEDQE
jgi:hypothetical protein